MKIIKDPVHGYVRVSDEFLPLLDSSVVQRLRYVKQLGFSHLVYPGANHTRFEHSLGTMHLASLMGERLELDAEEQKLVTVAALLHDIGHGPYSHATEPLIEEFTGHGHQEIEYLVNDDPLAGVLEGMDLDPDEICAVVYGEHPLAGIIHGDLDVDRMDYLLRDAHYTGVPYGTVDAHRLIYSTLMTDRGIVLGENGIHAAESLLIARTLMRPAVYFHHVSRIAESMIRYAAGWHLKKVGTGEVSPLLRMDDAAFLHEMFHSPSEVARGVMERLYERQLYKRAVYVGKDRVNTSALNQVKTLHDESALAEEIAEAACVDPEQVLVDLPSFPSSMSMEVRVRNYNDLMPLDQISPLINTLNSTRQEQWRMGVYSTPECRRVVEEAATEVLHIKKPTRQDRLIL